MYKICKVLSVYIFRYIVYDKNNKSTIRRTPSTVFIHIVEMSYDCNAFVMLKGAILRALEKRL